MGTTYNPPIVTDGLVFCVDAANQRSYPKSGTTWSDLVGSNNGTLINSVSFDAGNGGSLQTDASNERIEFGSVSMDLYNISFWVYLSSEVTSASTYSYPIQYGSNSQEVIALGAFSSYATDETLAIASADNYARTYIKDNIPAGWNYITFNWNGSTYDILLGTESKTTYASSYPGHVPRKTVNELTVGAYQFFGKISNVSIYNRALTADEVRQNYEATVGRFS
jgi:hypothetical protein